MKNKLLNFTICQALIIIGMSLLCVKCQEQKLSASENVTVYDRSFNRVLSRRKRFLLWRPGSNVLILEWDIFYPLPSSWRLPKKPEKIFPPPIIEPEIPIEPVESWSPPKEVWQPEGGWTNDVIQEINEQNKNIAGRRNWRPPIKQMASNQQLMDRRWNENSLYKSLSAPPQPVSLKLNPLLNKNPWKQTQMNRNNFNFNQQYNQPNRRLPSPSSSSSTVLAASKPFDFSSISNKIQNYFRKTRSVNEEIVKDTKADNKELDEDWEHYYAHRDRRDLYDRIVNASPMNSNFVRNCLLRTMCEVQHFLHPKGYSLLHDMLRVIFTVPIKDDMDDDYSNAVRAGDQDCVHFYSKNCPVSILALLLHAKNG
ncbi:unnamed protein product [Chironomus riparius]|uniref:Uncharacterized protein n=1 Tax=Chironomus riparius TaxID=315576 RepID=A0A9P0J561_9DIPT|nr:unnamed protein product [Chironomus riparius]